MPAVPAPLARLIKELVKLPGIGEKTATRLAFHLLRTDRANVDALAAALRSVREEICTCGICYALAASDPCDLCTDPQRSGEILCVVEESADLLAIERSGGFKGRYHVLQGTLAPLDGIGPDELRVKELLNRLSSGTVREVILATNPTSEGEATALYLARLIKPLNIAVSRIAQGLPMGADLEYADSVTLGRALDGRRQM